MSTHSHTRSTPPTTVTTIDHPFSMPQTCSTFPTTCSGTIRAQISTTKCRKTSDSDQLAAKRLKVQDDNNNNTNNNNSINNNNNSINNNNDNHDNSADNNNNNLVPVKGGRGGHKACKQRNCVNNKYVSST